MVTTTPAGSIGGVESVVFNLIDFLKKEGIETDNLYAYEKYKNPISSNIAFLRLGKKIRQCRYSIVHSHDNAVYYFVKNSKPTIHTSHGTWANYFDAMPKTLKNRILSANCIRMERFITQHALHIIAVSNYVKNSLIKQHKIPEEKITVIHNGINTKKFKPIKRKSSKRIALWIGTNPILKGLDIAIEASRDMNIKLLVAGIKRKNTEHVEYLGRVMPEKMPCLYHKADFLLFPSRYESHPVVPLEAMASGLPIIVSKSSHVEIIKNGKEGFIIPSFSKEDYKNAIEKLIRNIKRMSKNARKTAEKYDWGIQIKKYIEIYNEFYKPL